MAADSRVRRCAIWFAISDLKSRGYLIDRCCGKDRIFDIIAWNRENILGLLIRTARSHNIGSRHDEIAKIAALVKDRMVPGKTELWLYHPGGISRYHIVPGGAMFIREAGK